MTYRHHVISCDTTTMSYIVISKRLCNPKPSCRGPPDVAESKRPPYKRQQPAE